MKNLVIATDFALRSGFERRVKLWNVMCGALHEHHVCVLRGPDGYHDPEVAHVCHCGFRWSNHWR